LFELNYVIIFAGFSATLLSCVWWI